MNGTQHYYPVTAAGKPDNLQKASEGQDPVSQHRILGFYFQCGLNISATSGSKALGEDKTNEQSANCRE